MKLEDLKVKITVDTTELDQFLEKLERAKRELIALTPDTLKVINQFENVNKIATSRDINITINNCG